VGNNGAASKQFIGDLEDVTGPSNLPNALGRIHILGPNGPSCNDRCCYRSPYE